jgi:SAM-dependent methyltransferase
VAHGWDTEEDAIEFQAQAFRLIKKLTVRRLGARPPAVRKQTTVVFGVNVPKDLHDAWWRPPSRNQGPDGNSDMADDLRRSSRSSSGRRTDGEHGWPEIGPRPTCRSSWKLGSGAGKTALDLGCGEGATRSSSAGAGTTVTASTSSRSRSRKPARTSARPGCAPTFVVGNALDLRFDDGAFDVVLDYGCFHHVVTRDWPRYRREIARVLKPGGHLILSVFSTKFRHHGRAPDAATGCPPQPLRPLLHPRRDPVRVRARVRAARLSRGARGLNGFFHALLCKH